MTARGGSVHPALSPAALIWVTKAVDLQLPVLANQMPEGRSNLTFVLTDRVGNGVVMRRPPLGPLLSKAHDVAREYRVQSALTESAVPVQSRRVL